MSAPPYMKLWVGDYLADTTHLTVIEHGAYILLLMGMWRANGSLPATDAALARVARCTPKQWAEVKGQVLPLFQRSRSKLTHKRLAKEMAKYNAVSDTRSEAGKRGAEKKHNKSNRKAQANAKQMPPYSEPEPEESRLLIESKPTLRREATEARHEGASPTRSESGEGGVKLKLVSNADEPPRERRLNEMTREERRAVVDAVLGRAKQ